MTILTFVTKYGLCRKCNVKYHPLVPNPDNIYQPPADNPLAIYDSAVDENEQFNRIECKMTLQPGRV